MSPEQARGLETDARSDIFSLGIVLYEMVTLHRPFEGESPSDVIVALLSQEPPFAEHAPDLPGDLQRLVGRMLAKDRAGRYQTADEARRALKRLKQDLTPAADSAAWRASRGVSVARARAKITKQRRPLRVNPRHRNPASPSSPDDSRARHCASRWRSWRWRRSSPRRFLGDSG
jgi:serine/threonine protein kinase